jgi:hypothetical protein
MEAFRTALAPPAPELVSVIPPKNDTILAENVSEPGLYVHEAVKGYPMTVDSFNLKQFWDSPTSDMQDRIKSVDEWIQNKAKERNLSDSKASYDEITKGILKQIGKSDNEAPLSTFERIENAIEAFKRLESAKLPPVLDVKSMTPEEYKKTRA